MGLVRVGKFTVGDNITATTIVEIDDYFEGGSWNDIRIKIPGRLIEANPKSLILVTPAN